jgi:diguanylate cyclase (GGDEF)-like protein/PAS domain S-box-containing protein
VEISKYLLSSALPESLGSAWFENCLNHLNDAILITEAEPFDDPGPRILWANDIFYRITGYDPSEVIGKTPRILQGPLTDKSVLKTLRSAIEEGKVCRVEVLNYKKDGSTFWSEFEVTPVANEVGCYTHLISVQRDITKRKQNELILESSENRLRLAMSLTKQRWFDLNIQTEVTLHSPEFSQLFGYDPTDHRSSLQAWEDSLHPDDQGAVMAAFRSCLSQGSPFSMEYRWRTKDGNWLWVNSSAEIVEWSSSQQPLRMIGIDSDITERKQAELQEKSRNHILELITSGESLRVILKAIVDAVEQENPTMLCSILLLDNAGKHLLYGAASSLPDFYNDAINGIQIGIGAGSCGTAAFINERVIVDDIQIHPYWTLYKELASKAGLGACWSEPIRSTKKEVLGTFAIYHHNVNFPTEANIVLIEQTASLASIAIERRQAEAKLEHLALYDLLTDLPNRVLLADRINHSMAQCQRRNQLLAVAYLDLDGFKVVNDTHGHDIGDKLLVALSQRMKEALRESDTLARIGGDEFVAVIVDLEKIGSSKPVLKRLLKAAASFVTVGDVVMQVSASIGVTVFPQDGVDADQLMRHADQAMYIAKQAGKNQYHLFDTALDNAINIRQESIADIRLALGRGEFVLHYQPKVNMRTGQVIGVEGLIRWQHPDRGLVPPLEFLPVVEGHAISLELGEWVIDTALSQISQWRDMGVTLPLLISVNISAYQLQQPSFTTRLAALLSAHPEVNPHFLVLEILETSALSNISQVVDTMNACHDLGVRFALDDFGTGYSSLTHLRRLPAYLIKIDQSFVRNMLEDDDDLAIVEGVVGLAKAFQLEVIAEGVETIEHGDELLKLGCELAQGYGIARPMPADDIPEWVSSWKTNDSWLA